MKYNDYIDDEEKQMVREPVLAYGASISQLDAIWALVLNQAEDVQRALEKRLHDLLVHKSERHTYTMEELHDRIALSEKQFAAGQYMTHEEVSHQLENLFESWR